MQRFAWDRDVPLNDANFDLKVNMLTCEEADTKGKSKRFSWVADLPLDRETVMPSWNGCLPANHFLGDYILASPR